MLSDFDLAVRDRLTIPIPRVGKTTDLYVCATSRVAFANRRYDICGKVAGAYRLPIGDRQVHGWSAGTWLESDKGQFIIMHGCRAPI